MALCTYLTRVAWGSIGRYRLPDGEEEVLQDTVLAAATGWPPPPTADVEPWVAGILRNKALDQHRRLRRVARIPVTDLSLPEGLLADDGSGGPVHEAHDGRAPDLERHVLARRLLRLLREHSVEWGRIVEMRAHGEEFPEIGVVMGLTPSQARHRHDAAIEWLRRQEARDERRLDPLAILGCLALSAVPRDVEARVLARVAEALAPPCEPPASGVRRTQPTAAEPDGVDAPTTALGSGPASSLLMPVAIFVGLVALLARCERSPDPSPPSPSPAIVVAPEDPAGEPNGDIDTGVPARGTAVAASRPPPRRAGAVARSADDEARLVREAIAAKARGQFTRAVELLREHARRYPAGKLTLTRQAELGDICTARPCPR
jgi:DNA-directed RNA polymerase specialized sigma24 family protein